MYLGPYESMQHFLFVSEQNLLLCKFSQNFKYKNWSGISTSLKMSFGLHKGKNLNKRKPFLRYCGLGDVIVKSLVVQLLVEGRSNTISIGG